MKSADLHLHTTYSDGTFNPQELVREALKYQVSAIAVVDHDTVDGVTEVLSAGEKEQVEVVPGIELTAECDGSEIHILGYYVDHTDQRFLKQLDHLKENRIARIYKITEKLEALGMHLDPQRVFEIAGYGSVGRMHVARAMVSEKIVDSVEMAFKKYIGDRGPAYVSGFKLSPEKAVNLIKGVGGVPVLAHPYTVMKDEVLQHVIDAGIMGLEAYYPEHSQSMINYYLGVAQQRSLLVTGGSDCHGSGKPEIHVGSMTIPYELLERLKKARTLQVRP